jgi:predicted NBD/HSP70 family sugar kinase
MDHFAGLDVSVKDTSICIVDDTGRITREVKVASEPDALLAVLLKLQETGAYSITSSARKADYTWGATATSLME